MRLLTGDGYLRFHECDPAVRRTGAQLCGTLRIADDVPDRTPLSPAFPSPDCECDRQTGWNGAANYNTDLYRVSCNAEWDFGINLDGAIHQTWRGPGVRDLRGLIPDNCDDGVGEYSQGVRDCAVNPRGRRHTTPAAKQRNYRVPRGRIRH